MDPAFPHFVRRANMILAPVWVVPTWLLKLYQTYVMFVHLHRNLKYFVVGIHTQWPDALETIIDWRFDGPPNGAKCASGDRLCATSQMEAERSFDRIWCHQCNPRWPRQPRMIAMRTLPYKKRQRSPFILVFSCIFLRLLKILKLYFFWLVQFLVFSICRGKWFTLRQ